MVAFAIYEQFVIQKVVSTLVKVMYHFCLDFVSFLLVLGGPFSRFRRQEGVCARA